MSWLSRACGERENQTAVISTATTTRRTLFSQRWSRVTLQTATARLVAGSGGMCARRHAAPVNKKPGSSKAESLARQGRRSSNLRVNRGETELAGRARPRSRASGRQSRPEYVPELSVAGHRSVNETRFIPGSDNVGRRMPTHLLLCAEEGEHRHLIAPNHVRCREHKGRIP